MEDYEGTRTETFDELVTKHTRRELEEMALKLGVENLGGTKSQLADAILEAFKRQRAQPKSATMASPKEAPMVEKPTPVTKPVPTGVKGVMAKAAAIDSKTAEVQKAGKAIREEGIRRMNKRVEEFNGACDWMSREMRSNAHKMMEDGRQRFESGQAEFRQSLDAQIKENREAISNIRAEAGRLRSSEEEMAREFQRAGRNIRDSGYKNLQKGLSEFRKGVDSQIQENQKAILHMNSAARELQNRAASFQGEINRYQEQDLKNYIRDFYYG